MSRYTPDTEVVEAFEKDFTTRFPNKIAEVVDDFGSTVKRDILDLILADKLQTRHQDLKAVQELVEGMKKTKDEYYDGIYNQALEDLLHHIEALEKQV